MPDVRFGVLGPLTIHVDGRATAVQSGRRRTALSCLLVHAGSPVAPDVLIEAIWGERLPSEPRDALHVVISRLRSVLGSEVVRRDPAGYLLDVPADAIDAHRFEHLCSRAEDVDSAAAARLLADALALWRGPAYAEVADHEFAMLEAGRLDALRLTALEARAAALLDLGEPAAAIECATAALAEQPFREHAVGLVVTALYRAGRQADALARCRDHRALLAAELGLDPSPALLELESRILDHDLGPARGALTATPSWLDTSTAFVGRDDVVEDLVRALGSNRLVTITGPGGVGKSRLVAEALPALADTLRLPATVVELTGVVPGGASEAIAGALGIRGAAAEKAVLEHLTNTPVLLVLDCCEHLLEEVAALAASVGRRCPRVRVLATSRHRLGSTSEAVVPLAPLALPAPDDPLERQRRAAAVLLMADRTRRVRPGFEVTADNVEAIGALCRRLDGLPLALELAASRVAVLGVEQVHRRLSAEVVDARTGELEALFAWSFRLLEDEQQRVLLALATFASDVDADDVRAMTMHLRPGIDDAVGALAELIESSLVMPLEDGGRMRYRLLGVVRAFAVRRLDEAGEVGNLHHAHANWVRVEVDTCMREWPRGDGALLSRRLTDLVPEVVVALRRCLAYGWLDLATGISGALVLCLHWTPPRELNELMLDTAEAAALVPAAHFADGVGAGAFVAVERGELPRAERLAQAALAMGTEGGSCASALLALGIAAMYAGELDESTQWFTLFAAEPGMAAEANSSLALTQCYRDDLDAAGQHAAIALSAAAAAADASAAFASYAAGEVASRTDPDRGAELLAEAVAAADRVGAEQVGRVARIARFALLVRTGRHEQAAAVGAPLLDRLRRAGMWPQAWTIVRISAELLAARGRVHEAALLLTATAAAPGAPPLIGADVDGYGRLRESLVEQLGAGVVEQIATMASSVPRTQVVERAARALRQLADAAPAGTSAFARL
ncbi:BTAD domain-containing putative transcriptional regulator [Dietzia maris]